MLLVLASRNDLAARRLVARWRAQGTAAELMLCADLARRGWRVTDDGAPNFAVVGSRSLDSSSLRGVVTRLPFVTAVELPEIHPVDCAYAAAEMQAFLLAWLAGLACPVVNRPVPGSLAGPAFSIEQWVALAAREKLKVRPVVRRHLPPAAGAQGDADAAADVDAAAAAPAQMFHVHVVGERCFDDPAAGARDDDGGADAASSATTKAAHKAALRLARAAETDLLRVTFQRDEPGGAAGPVIVAADPWIDAGDPAIADAIFARLTSLASGARRAS